MSQIPKSGGEASQIIVAQSIEGTPQAALDRVVPVIRDVFPSTSEINISDKSGTPTISIDTGSDTIYASDLAEIDEVGIDKINIESLGDVEEEDIIEAFRGQLFDEGDIYIKGSMSGVFGGPIALREKRQELRFVVLDEIPRTEEVMETLSEEVARSIGNMLSWKPKLDMDGPTISDLGYEGREVYAVVEEAVFLKEDLVSVTYGTPRTPIQHVDGVDDAEPFEKEVFEDGYARLK